MLKVVTVAVSLNLAKPAGRPQDARFVVGLDIAVGAAVAAGVRVVVWLWTGAARKTIKNKQLSRTFLAGEEAVNFIGMPLSKGIPRICGGEAFYGIYYSF